MKRSLQILEELETVFYVLGHDIYKNELNKKFQEEGKPRNIPEFYALCHSELSEGLEGARHGNPPSDKIPLFTQEEEELADVIIRILGRSYNDKLRIAKAIYAKMEYNESRPIKHGGKLF